MEGTGGAGASGLGSKSRFVAAVLAAVFIASGLTALVTSTGAYGNPLGPNPAAAPYRVLRIGVGGLQLLTLNPNSMTLTMEFVVVYNVYSTLITFDKNYQYHPDLAYSWSVSPDGLNWTFHLVRGAYFTNPYAPNDRSHPVTADDVVYSFALQMNNTATIFNAYTTQLSAVWKIDSYTVGLRTKGPFAGMMTVASVVPIFPAYLWSSVWYPGCGNKCDPVKNTPSIHPLGSGAVYYDIANSSISTGPLILKRNPNYYGPTYYCEQVRPNEIRYLLYSNTGLMVTDFQNGQSGLDSLISVDAPSYKNTLPASGTNGFFKWAADSGFVGEVSANVMTPAIRSTNNQFNSGSDSQLLQNDTVRLAIAMSINKSSLIQFGLLGLGTVADTLVPDTNPWHYAISPADQYHFDPQAARALLMQAGWNRTTSGAPATSTTTPLAKAGGANPLVFRLYTIDTHPEFAPMIQNISEWLFAAGIQTTSQRYAYTPGTPNYYIGSQTFMDNAWKTADYDLWLWDWQFSPVSDPSLDILEVETTGAIGPTSDNYYSNATYDALYLQSLQTTNLTTRRTIVNTMQKMLYDYHSYILPFYEWNLYAATNRTDLASGWQNWGDWATNPALAPDSDLPNLYFQVYPHDQQPPVVQSLSPVHSYTGLPSYFNAVATDAEGDIVNYTWSFGDGSAAQVTTTGSVSHIYAVSGNYTVTVRVSDPEWASCGSTVAVEATNPGGTVNLPPLLKSFVANATQITTNQSVKFTLTANDTEGDSLYIRWTFGDGSAVAVSFVNGSSVNTKQDQIVVQTHAYTKAGRYEAKVNLTDNTTSPGLSHYLEQPVNITVTNPTGGGGGGGGTTTPAGNPFLNYGLPIAIVAIVVIAVAALVWRRRRTMKKEAAQEDHEAEEPSEPKPPAPPP